MKICIQCGFEFDLETWKCPSCGYVPIQEQGINCFAPHLDHSLSNGDGFDNQLFPLLFELESRNFWFKSRNKLILWMLDRYGKRTNSLLEIGCGTGYVLSAIETNFPNIRVNGSELFLEGLQFANQRVKNATLLQIDAQNIPFKSEFDTICAFDVLEHIENDLLVLQQINKALVDQGKLLISVPQHMWLWSPADQDARHARRYDHKDLQFKLNQSGFKVLRQTSFVTFLLPLMFAARTLAKKNKSYDPIKELKMGKIMNSLLEIILSVERYLITIGISFRWGGSLFVVAQKIRNLEDSL